MCKLGNKENEYEDSISYNLDALRFAIADGASGSAYAELWASSLTGAYVDSGDSLFEDPVGVVASSQQDARKKWYTGIKWETLPWFLKNKAVMGSYSTLLLLEMRYVGGRVEFVASAVGDSCLFVVDSRLKVSFPISDHREFGLNPKLLWSGQGYPAKIDARTSTPQVHTVRGVIEEGDRMILATDAVAMWLLRNASDDPWEILLENPGDLRKAIADLINRRVMRNDDITAAVITFSD